MSSGANILKHIRQKEIITLPDEGQIEIKSWDLEQMVELSEPIANTIEEIAEMFKKVLSNKEFLEKFFDKDTTNDERLGLISQVFEIAPLIIQLLKKVPKDIKLILEKTTRNDDIAKQLDLPSTIECMEAIVKLNFTKSPLLKKAFSQLSATLGLKGRKSGKSNNKKPDKKTNKKSMPNLSGEIPKKS